MRICWGTSNLNSLPATVLSTTDPRCSPLHSPTTTGTRPGTRFSRVFLSFELLIDGGQLPEIKRHTNVLEETLAASDKTVKRPVNLDPGYLEHSKVILASTKNFYHRMYLSRGIFGEVTMHFRNGAYEFFPWTYPDYKSTEYQKFFLELRTIYREQLRRLCVLKNPE